MLKFEVPLIETSRNESFESLLLKTVTPSAEVPSRKRRRVDGAEIITMDTYLLNLQDQKTQNELEAKTKAEKKQKLFEKRAEVKVLKEKKQNECLQKKLENKKGKSVRKLESPQTKLDKSSTTITHNSNKTKN